VNEHQRIERKMLRSQGTILGWMLLGAFAFVVAIMSFPAWWPLVLYAWQNWINR
jgi:hypothetical protein